jgi:nucleotide-binding universal stress UspA family protein
VRSQVRALGEGQFLSSSTNVCVFGNPGTGKTHLVCAVGHELVRRGHSVLFTASVNWDLAYVQFDRQPWPIDRVLAEASLDLNRFLEPHLPDLTKTAAATRRAVFGAVPEQISGVAEEENADLIIMSPRRRRALRHMIFGAITDKVMRLSPCPVLSITEPKPSKTWRGKLLPLYFGGPRPRAAGI